MNVIEHFLIQFGIKELEQGEYELFSQDNKYFLVTRQMNEIIKKTKKVFYAGIYLGKSRGKNFFPSINFINHISKRTKNKIWVEKEAAWLFVCGRDLFAAGIRRSSSNLQKVTITIVLNMNSEVLGFGKVLKGLKEPGVVVQNILDIGDFLRRERNR